jgi:cathepsin F
VKDLPASFDWREHSAVSSVKDQGSIGSCWAFSTVGNIEGQHYLKNSELLDLSVEQLVECDATVDPDPKSKNADCGIFGGWPYLAMQYVISAGGLAKEQDYEYCVGKGCYPCAAEGYDEEKCGPGLHPPQCKVVNPCRKDVAKSAKIDDWKALSNDEVQLAQQLTEIGPISVGLDASWLQFYWHGVFEPWLGCSDQLNHAVLIVGFGSDSGDYWIVKNSWGTKWGEKGYFRIRRNKAMCGINSNPITAIIN